MTKFNKLALFGYTLLVEISCFLLLIFFGILADENIKFEKFAKVYTLGVEFNYNLLAYFSFFIFVLSLIIQVFLVINLVKGLQKK